MLNELFHVRGKLIERRISLQSADLTCVWNKSGIASVVGAVRVDYEAVVTVSIQQQNAVPIIFGILREPVEAVGDRAIAGCRIVLKGFKGIVRYFFNHIYYAII